MIWQEIAPFIKWIAGIGLVVVAYFRHIYVIKQGERERLGRIRADDEKRNLKIENDNQVKEVRRSIAQAHEAKTYAKRVEDALAKIDVSLLNDLKLDQLSQEPLAFTDLLDSSSEPTRSTENEDD